MAPALVVGVICSGKGLGVPSGKATGQALAKVAAASGTATGVTSANGTQAALGLASFLSESFYQGCFKACGHDLLIRRNKIDLQIRSLPFLSRRRCG